MPKSEPSAGLSVLAQDDAYASRVMQRGLTADMRDLAVLLQRQLDCLINNIGRGIQWFMAVGTLAFVEADVVTIVTDVAGRFEALLDQQCLRLAARDGVECCWDTAHGEVACLNLVHQFLSHPLLVFLLDTVLDFQGVEAHLGGRCRERLGLKIADPTFLQERMQVLFELAQQFVRSAENEEIKFVRLEYVERRIGQPLVVLVNRLRLRMLHVLLGASIITAILDAARLGSNDVCTLDKIAHVHFEDLPSSTINEDDTEAVVLSKNRHQRANVRNAVSDEKVAHDAWQAVRLPELVRCTGEKGQTFVVVGEKFLQNMIPNPFEVGV